MLCILIIRPLHSFQQPSGSHATSPSWLRVPFVDFYNLLTPLSAIQMHILWGNLLGRAQPTSGYFPFTEKRVSPAAAIKGQGSSARGGASVAPPSSMLELFPWFDLGQVMLVTTATLSSCVRQPRPIRKSILWQVSSFSDSYILPSSQVTESLH